MVAALIQFGWKQMKFDRCLFGFYSQTGELIALSGVHVDDSRIARKSQDPCYIIAKEHLRSSFRFGKWSLASEGFSFAGCFIKQMPQGILMDQEDCVRGDSNFS